MSDKLVDVRWAGQLDINQVIEAGPGSDLWLLNFNRSSFFLQFSDKFNAVKIYQFVALRNIFFTEIYKAIG